jgi:site-specific DNA-methyltransferase (adenine-specific)
MTPYYDEDGITIYLGSCRSFEWPEASVLVTDPPYGINYRTNQARHVLPRSIVGDSDTGLRDWVLDLWYPRPALVFGTWKRPIPEDTRQVLIWDTKGALGMGALDLPWKPAHQQIYVIGEGFQGRRDSDVLRFAPVQSMAYNGRVHPHQKPVELMRELISKCPPGSVIDPFMGSGSTLRAAKDLGRKAIGIEIEERYCEIAVQRLAQGVLSFDG